MDEWEKPVPLGSLFPPFTIDFKDISDNNVIITEKIILQITTPRAPLITKCDGIKNPCFEVEYIVYSLFHSIFIT